MIILADTFLISFLVLLLWMQTCMIITTKQRKEIFPPKDDGKWPYLFFKNKLFAKNSVSDLKHLWHLMTFRNPKKLYDSVAFEEFEPNKIYKLYAFSSSSRIYGYFHGYSQDFHKFILHREDGPAVIYSYGTTEWRFEDKDITGEVEKWLTDHEISDYTCMTEEDKFALSFYMRSLI